VILALVLCYSTPPQVYDTCSPVFSSCETVGAYIVCQEQPSDALRGPVEGDNHQSAPKAHLG
jgi:hypothetical protein